MLHKGKLHAYRILVDNKLLSMTSNQYSAMQTDAEVFYGLTCRQSNTYVTYTSTRLISCQQHAHMRGNESIGDSRDGADTPTVCVHWKAFTRNHSGHIASLLSDTPKYK